jgi:hypothetical protein
VIVAPNDEIDPRDRILNQRWTPIIIESGWGHANYPRAQQPLSRRIR